MTDKIIQIKDGENNVFTTLFPESISNVSEKTDEDFFLQKTVESNIVIDKMEGKSYQSNNLLPYPYYQMNTTVNGITFTVNSDGSIMANGTKTDDSKVTSLYIERNRSNIITPGKKYVLMDGISDSSVQTYNACCEFADADNISIPWGTDNGHTRNGVSAVLTAPENAVYINIWIRVGLSSSSADNVTYKPMLVEVNEDGTYPTEYDSPIITADNPREIVSVGDSENLIPFPYSDGMSKTDRGISISVDNTGIITLNGTAESTGSLFVLNNFTMHLPIGTYYTTAFDNPLGTTETRLVLQIRDNENTNIRNIYSDTGNQGSFTITQETPQPIIVRLYVYQGLALNNYQVKPLIKRVEEPLPYRKYCDGLVFEEQGKNLIPYPYINGTDRTHNGITYRADPDGRISVISGTASGNSAYQLLKMDSNYMLKAGHYRLITNCNKSESTSTYDMWIGVRRNSDLVYVVSQQVVGSYDFIITEDEARTCHIGLNVNVISGNSAAGAYWKPMLVKVNSDGTYPTEYEIYHKKQVIVPIEPLRSIGDVKDELIRTNDGYDVIRRVNKVYLKDFQSLVYTAKSSASYQSMLECYFGTSIPLASKTELLLATDWNSAKSNYANSGVCNNSTISKVGILQSGNPRIRINVPDECTDTATSLTWATNNNVYVMYALAEPIIEHFSREQVETISSLESFEDQTYLNQSMTIKGSMDINYPTNNTAGLILKEIVSSDVSDAKLSREIKDKWQGSGYNLIPYPYSDGMSKTTAGGMSFTVNSDGSIIANGISNTDSQYNCKSDFNTLQDGKKYIVMGGLSPKCYARIRVGDKSTSAFIKEFKSTGTESFVITEPIDNTLYQYAFQIIIAPNTQCDNFAFKPMLVEINEDGTYPTEYQRYAKGNVELTDSFANYYTKTQIDSMIGDVESLLSAL